MRPMNRTGVLRSVLLAALVATTVGTLLLPTGPVFACSCVPPEPPPTAFAQAKAVFVGTVTGITGQGLAPSLVELVRRWLSPSSPHAFYGRRVSVRVTDSWKGVTTANVELQTGYSSADCGYDFIVGNQYVIYAYQGQASLETNICRRTIDVASGASDLQYLQTLPKLGLTAAPSTPPLPLLFLSLGLLGGILLLTVWARRRQLSKR